MPLRRYFLSTEKQVSPKSSSRSRCSFRWEMFGRSSGLPYSHHATAASLANPPEWFSKAVPPEDQPHPKQTNGLNGSPAAAPASASAGLAPAVSR
jgi:hypothetical protein